MTFALSTTSKNRLKGVHPNLVKVIERAIEITEVDFMVVEGVRTRENMMINWGKGRTAAQCAAWGIPAKYAKPDAAKVTWLRNPFASNHAPKTDGYGYAVDLLPAPYDWKNLKDFDKMADAVLEAAKELGIAVRWGADWNKNGKSREKGETDSPHFELG